MLDQGRPDPDRRLDREILDSFREDPIILAGPANVWEKNEEVKLIRIMDKCQEQYWEMIA